MTPEQEEELTLLRGKCNRPMREPSVQEKNETIAKWMGFTQHHNPPWMNVPEGEDLKYRAFKLHKDKLLYDTSWDWLIPVVEKIEKTKLDGLEFSVDMDKYSTQIRWTINRGVMDPKDMNIEVFNSPSKIEATHEAVYQFILWHQKQKP